MVTVEPVVMLFRRIDRLEHRIEELEAAQATRDTMDVEGVYWDKKRKKRVKCRRKGKKSS